MQVHPVEPDQFFDCRLNGKGRSGPAQVMAGIPMPVSYSNCNTGYCAGSSTPECEGILAGMAVFLVGGTGPARPECPAKSGITGTDKLILFWHAS
jgi:hypothetical protein